MAEVEAGTLHGRQRKETIELELVLPRAKKKKKESEFVSLSFDWMTRTMEEQRDGQKPEMKLGLKIVGDDALEPIN